MAHGGARDNDKNLVHDTLDSLAPTEMYWAFPGDYAFQQLYRLLDTDEFATLARVVSRCVGGLMSGLYRRKHIDLGVDGEQTPADLGEVLETEEERIRRRPYFEVLIVDDITPAQQHRQRDELAAVSRDEDSFTYQPVFVPSFEDALIAVLFNHNIQAVVIRFDFHLHSKNRLPVLTRYLAQADCHDLDDIEARDYGSTLADVIGRVRPELDLYLVTAQSVEYLAGRTAIHAGESSTTRKITSNFTSISCAVWRLGIRRLSSPPSRSIPSSPPVSFTPSPYPAENPSPNPTGSATWAISTA